MLSRFPDIPGQAKISAQNVAKTMREAGGKGIADTAMNKATRGLVANATECVRFPFKVVAVPVAQTVGDAARWTARTAVSLTGRAIASIPWIPVPGRSDPSRKASREETVELASLHDALPPPPVFRPGDLGSGPR